MESGSARKRLAGLTVLFLVLLGVLAARVWFKPPPAEEPLPEPVETFQGNEQLLAGLRGAALPAASGDARPGDWPQWRGPLRDGVSREAISFADWPAAGPRRIWKVSGGEGHSGLAVAGDRVYTMVQDGEQEAVLCLSTSSGAELWRHRSPGRFTETYAGTGPHATPTVHDGRVYAVGATGQFHCLDAQSGQRLWHHDLLREFETPNPEYGMSCSPLVEGDLVIVLPGSVKGGSVAAFDRKDGRRVWSNLHDRSGYSSPVAATLAGRRQLVVVTGESVAGIAPSDGAPLWRHPWTTHRDCNVATPVVAGDYVFVSSGYNKGCALLHVASDAGGVRPVYEHNRMRNHFSTGVLDGEQLYGFDEAFLVCMDLRSGKVLWKQRGFEKGSLLLAAGHLIVLGENGRLAIAKTDRLAYRELCSFTITRSRCWAPPSLARGRLYVRDQESIFCFDLGAR